VRTGGAFDPTVQPLWALHARGTPSEADVAAAKALVDWTKVEVGPRRIVLGRPGMAVTLNGIAQGFAADRVREVLRAHGVRHALADTGEFNGMGRRPDGDAWRVGIQHPRVADAWAALASLEDRFLATSGDYATPFSADFKSHHIFDPATGRSPEALSSVTILAPSGIEADALSTSVFVLGPDRGLALCASRPGVDALTLLKDGTPLATPNFPRVA
jgi:thiamine biosynthesis lipoprotein